jgi:GNAT superfamily N-acetyltransferase
VNVRPRTPADVQALIEVLRRVHDADGYPTVWPDDVSGWVVGDSGYGAWVAVIDDNVVGHVGLARPGLQASTQVWVATTQRPVEWLVEVTRLFASPDASGFGVGHRLLQRAVAGAHELGLWPVLDVRHEGRPGASRLYEAAGWRMVGSVPRRLEPEVILPFDCWVGPPPPT